MAKQYLDIRISSEMPLISIVMSAYNAEKHIDCCVQSILDQTFPDYEFLIIDDASTDNTFRKLNGYRDSRLKLYKNQRNKGYPSNLNCLIGLSKGKYIARMDADDMALPSRLEEQVEFMEANPDYGLCGTWIEIFGDKNEVIKYPLLDVDLRFSLLFQNVFAHPSVIMRKSIIDEYNLEYDPCLEPAEDYRMWVKIAELSKIANIPVVLLKYRWHNSQISQKKKELQQANYIATIQYQLKKIGLDTENSNIIRMIFLNSYPFSLSFIKKAEKALRTLKEKNDYTCYLSTKSMNSYISDRWEHLTYGSTRLGLVFFWLFMKSPLTEWSNLPLSFRVNFFIKCLIRK